MLTLQLDESKRIFTQKDQVGSLGITPKPLAPKQSSIIVNKSQVKVYPGRNNQAYTRLATERLNSSVGSLNSDF